MSHRYNPDEVVTHRRRYNNPVDDTYNNWKTKDYIILSMIILAILIIMVFIAVQAFAALWNFVVQALSALGKYVVSEEFFVFINTYLLGPAGLVGETLAKFLFQVANFIFGFMAETFTKFVEFTFKEYSSCVCQKENHVAVDGN